MMKLGHRRDVTDNDRLILSRARENLSSGFPTRSDTNRTVQPHIKARGSKFRTWEVARDCSVYEAKTKAPITAQPNLSFVFAYAKNKNNRFSNDAAHFIQRSFEDQSK